MIRVILIDDEPLAREVVKEYLEEFSEIEVVGECGDGFEGVKAISEHQPDLIFLDVQMPKITGFEMLELLEFPPAVIFTTAFDEFAIKAFEANAVDYLLKPFNKERFRKAMHKWQERYQLNEARQHVETLISQPPPVRGQQERIVVKTGAHIKIIPSDDIHYIEAFDDYVKIHTPEGAYLKKRTMNYYESLLDPARFARIHRSYIIQLSQITRLDPYERDSYMAVLKSGKNLPVSKSGYSRLKAVLGI